MNLAVMERNSDKTSANDLSFFKCSANSSRCRNEDGLSRWFVGRTFYYSKSMFCHLFSSPP